MSVNLDKAMDKAWEDEPLAELLDAPAAALAGLTERHDELLRKLSIRTLSDLGTNVHFALAGALVALANKTG